MFVQLHGSEGREEVDVGSMVLVRCVCARASMCMHVGACSVLMLASGFSCFEVFHFRVGGIGCVEPRLRPLEQLKEVGQLGFLLLALGVEDGGVQFTRGLLPSLHAQEVTHG
mmetsp:Transcript_1651/g.2769  ORF Transcript_1651/g.2769 Transcript_1651/m.2769 type:complete len:112 (-) Transcript_1651:512-847(-)